MPSDAISSEIVRVRVPGDAHMLQRRSGVMQDREAQLVAVLQDLTGEGTGLVELKLRKGLEARVPATVKALAVDLACYARFVRGQGGIGLPASEARLVAYMEDCEVRRLKPATVSRRLSSLAVAHHLVGVSSCVGAGVVRDALRGLRRRLGSDSARPVRCDL